jgi:Arylsulfotransferase (ASST)
MEPTLRALGRLAPSAVALALLLWPGAAAAAPTVTISPLPGTLDASPHTQISFLGAPADQIHDVSVVGSQSGRHAGRLESYQSASGASFLPSKGFTQGERVSVSALIGSGSHPGKVTGSFQVARLFHYRFPAKKTHQAQTSGSDVQSFISEPDLHPTTVEVSTSLPTASAGDVFFAFNEGHAQWGPTIVSGNGELVWFHQAPPDEHAMDFKVSEYEQQPVLVWWQGYIPPIGVGFGHDQIYNEHYQKLAQVNAGNGYFADLHEIKLTPQGQAYITAYSLVHANMSSVHGPSDAGLLDAVVQEIDVKTGLVMWEWQSVGHVSLSESYSHPPRRSSGVYDFFHVNSISLDPSGDGNILISARNTWAGYELNHHTGQIMWRLGGKKPSFKMGPGTETAYQHDIRWQPNGTITAFDDGASPQVHKQSRVIHEQIEWKTKEVKLISSDVHSPALVADSQGNDQLLSDGHSFVGWGQEPFFSEYGPGGQVLFNAQLPAPGDSYRAYRFPWKGLPAEKPSVAARQSGTGAVEIYASWNGATEVSSWKVLGWTEGGQITGLTTVPKSGFETAIPLSTADTWFAVQPLGAHGEVLGTSHAVKAGE